MLPLVVKKVLTRLSRRAWIIIGAVVVLAAGASVWVFGFLLPSQNQPQAITQTAAASLETMQRTVSSSGTVAPAVKEDVYFAVSGVVTQVAVAAGDVVEVGAVLATVDTLELNADLLDAKASLAEAQATLVSAQNDDDGSSAATARVSAASAAVDVQEAAVADAEAAFDDATLRAPAAGLITTVGISVGDKLSGSSAAASSSGGASTMGSDSAETSSSAEFSLVSTDAWSVEVTVGETDIANVESGQQVELTTSDGDEYFGTVSEVGMVPSTSSGSARYPVTVDITGTGDGLFDGVSVDVEIIYERRTEVLTVPSAAVTTTDDVSTVTLVDEDGSQKDVEVEVGETAGSLTEILSGVDEGDEVLVAQFTPGEGNSGGGFPGGGGGEFPGGGTFPDGFEPPSGGGFPGGTQDGDQ